MVLQLHDDDCNNTPEDVPLLLIEKSTEDSCGLIPCGRRIVIDFLYRQMEEVYLNLIKCTAEKFVLVHSTKEKRS